MTILTKSIHGLLSEVQGCVGFEDLTLGTTFVVGNELRDSTATMRVLPFQWTSQVWTSKGSLFVVDQPLAGNDGVSVLCNNVNLGFNVGGAECVTLRFHDWGGNVNLVVNGAVGNWDNFTSQQLGGIDIVVRQPVPGTNRGELILRGRFEPFLFRRMAKISFAIGGQELVIDDVCVR